jgi:hypothetical protein
VRLSRDIGSPQSSVDKQFENVNRQIARSDYYIFGLYGLIGAVIGGGFLLRSDLGDIKAQVVKSGAEIEGLRRDMTTVQGRIGAIETNTSQIVSGQNQMVAIQRQMAVNLEQINSKISAAPTPQLLALSPDEEQTIREFFGLNKGQPSPEKPKYGFGEIISDAKPLPNDLVTKLPKLKGFKYTFDPSNNSALIVGADDRIVAIIKQA